MTEVGRKVSDEFLYQVFNTRNERDEVTRLSLTQFHHTLNIS